MQGVERSRRGTGPDLPRNDVGDVRILCAGRPHQLVVHFDSRKLLIILKNSARLDDRMTRPMYLSGKRKLLAAETECADQRVLSVS